MGALRTAGLLTAVVVCAATGVVGGYAVGAATEPPASFSTPLGESPVGHQVKTPEPTDVPALASGDLRYGGYEFTVRQPPRAQVGLRLELPRGWAVTRSPSVPGEVKFVDPRRERGVRVEAGFAPDPSTGAARQKLIGQLGDSQPPENGLRILQSTDGTVVADDGRTLPVSTLVYTYIPNRTLRYVIVRWIATDGRTPGVEMSVTGLPQDADALQAVLARATESVRVSS